MNRPTKITKIRKVLWNTRAKQTRPGNWHKKLQVKFKETLTQVISKEGDLSGRKPMTSTARKTDTNWYVGRPGQTCCGENGRERREINVAVYAMAKLVAEHTGKKLEIYYCGIFWIYHGILIYSSRRLLKYTICTLL